MKAYYAHLISSINQRFINSLSNDPDLMITTKLTNLLFLTVNIFWTLVNLWKNIDIFCFFKTPQETSWANIEVPKNPSYNGQKVVDGGQVLGRFSEYLQSKNLPFDYDHAMWFTR